MAEPEMSQWGERLRERTQPLQPDDELYGWTHAILCEALAQPYLQVAELIDPPEPYPPWGPLFDINICPMWALPWLAQLIGVRIPAGLSEEDTRAYLKQAAGHNVGTVDAIRASINSTLVPMNPPAPATVYFRERDGSAYRLEVVTLDPETPDPALTQSVLESVLPGGLVLAYRHIEGWDYQAMTDESAALTPPGTYADLALAYAGGTYNDLRQHTIASGPVTPVLATVVPDTFDNSLDDWTNFTLTGTFPGDLTDKRVVFTDAQYQSDYDLEIQTADATTITARQNLMTVPAGTGVIWVANNDYTPFTNTLPLTSEEPVAAMSLTSCTPASGPEGTAVTLSGTGLTGVVTVVVDNGFITLATNVVVVDDSTVTCVMASAPAGALGACDVRATSPAGTAELPAGWSFTSSGE